MESYLFKVGQNQRAPTSAYYRCPFEIKLHFGNVKFHLLFISFSHYDNYPSTQALIGYGKLI